MHLVNDIPLTYCINDYNDLCNLLLINLPNTPNYKPPPAASATIEALLASKTKYLPKSVRYLSASNHLIENLMFRAIKHWCCISFKIVPIELELIKKDTPRSILYCVAAISMVTTTTTATEQQHRNILTSTSTAKSNSKGTVKKKVYDKSAEGFKKDVGFYFYGRAVHYLNEILFEDDYTQDLASSIIAIQCYFCLSYTANLLRLTDEQRTWHYLACCILRNNVKYIDVSPALRQCWYRWYYIDAWIALALNMECLLPDELPFATEIPTYRYSESNVKVSHLTEQQDDDGNTTILSTPPKNNNNSNNNNNNYHESIKTTTNNNNCSSNNKHDDNENTCCTISNDTLYEFAVMTQYMRRYVRCIQAGTLPHCYDNLTYELDVWWENMGDYNLHLSLCYFSMRLVILFALLQQSNIYYVDDSLLLDGLNSTLEILQGLQELKLMKCDQSTYHHMFFAIHRALKSIHAQIMSRKEFRYLEPYCRQQFEMNLLILEGTDAFMNDIYDMRSVGTLIEEDLYALGYVEEDIKSTTKRSIHVFRTIKSTKKAKKKLKSQE